MIERRCVVTNCPIHRAHVVQRHPDAGLVSQLVPQLEAPCVKVARFVVTGLHVTHTPQLTERERHAVLVVNLLTDLEALPQERLGTISLAQRTKDHPGSGDRRSEPLPIRQAARHLPPSLEDGLCARKLALRIQLVAALDQARGQSGRLRLRRGDVTRQRCTVGGCGRIGGLWTGVRRSSQRPDEQAREVIRRAFHPHPG